MKKSIILLSVVTLALVVGIGAAVWSCDDDWPWVSLSAPSQGATVSGTTTVSVNATDNVGVTKVELYIDDTLKATLTQAPYNWAWDTTAYANGQHTICAKAYDAANNVGTSATVTVTVSN